MPHHDVLVNKWAGSSVLLGGMAYSTVISIVFDGMMFPRA